MSRKRSLMSEQLKYEIARELGVDQLVSTQGWGAVSSRDCGSMVSSNRNGREEYLQPAVIEPK